MKYPAKRQAITTDKRACRQSPRSSAPVGTFAVSKESRHPPPFLTLALLKAADLCRTPTEVAVTPLEISVGSESQLAITGQVTH